MCIHINETIKITEHIVRCCISEHVLKFEKDSNNNKKLTQLPVVSPVQKWV